MLKCSHLENRSIKIQRSLLKINKQILQTRIQNEVRKQLESHKQKNNSAMNGIVKDSNYEGLPYGEYNSMIPIVNNNMAEYPVNFDIVQRHPKEMKRLFDPWIETQVKNPKMSSIYDAIPRRKFPKRHPLKF